MYRNALSAFISLISFIVFTAVLVPGYSQVQDDSSLYPPNAKPGECYAKVLVPAQYKTVTEQVVKREASEKIEVIPAEYEWVEEQILVKEAEEKLEIVPATYTWQEEQVLVKEASITTETVPPVYETVTETVVDQPARVVWKKGRGPIEKVDHATGEIMCLIEEPATYKTITKQVLKIPANTRKVDIPAEYKTVEKQVIDKPAFVKKVVVPAEYKTVKVRKLVAPSQEVRIPIPAEHQTVTKQVKVSAEQLSWRPVLCETNMSPDVIESIQRSLLAEGYSPGEIDGVVGSQTLAAAERFQRARGLARGGLTLETLRALDINF